MHACEDRKLMCILVASIRNWSCGLASIIVITLVVVMSLLVLLNFVMVVLAYTR